MNNVIRPSTLPTYQDCALRACVQAYWQDFKDKGYLVPFMKKAAAAAIGSAVHAAVNHLLRVKMSTGSLASGKEAAEAGVACFENEISKGWDIDDMTPNRGAGIDQVSDMTRIYTATVGVGLDPVISEQKYTVKLQRYIPGWELAGTIDNLNRVGVLADLKTGKVVKNFGTQGGSYSLLARQNGQTVNVLQVVHQPRHKYGDTPNKPEIVPFDRILSEKVAVRTMQKLAADMTAFRATGDATVIGMNPSSILCSEKFCPAWSWCPMGARLRK